MQIKQRRLLALLLISSQLGCLSFGVVGAARWLQQAFGGFITRNVAAQGRAFAFDLARRIDEAPISTIEPGTSDWDRLQELCERAELPPGAFAAVLRRDTGALVCHPNLKNDPSLLRTFPGRAPLLNHRGVAYLGEALTQAERLGAPIAAGQVEFQGVLYSATCLTLPKLNAVLAIYQSDATIAASAAELVNPLLRAGMILTVSVVAVTGLLTVCLINRFESTLTAVNASVEDEVDRRTQTLLKTRNAVVFGLAKLSESRDADASGHLERMRTFVTVLASEMAKNNPEIDRHFVANLSVAATLHDVGKVGLPDAVLMKNGPFTAAERRAMQLHTELGGECLAAISRQLGDDEFLELGRQIALSHHEQWDGSGYPRGLQGRSIPLAARIVALADVYDALTSHRPYRAALTHGQAREWIVTHYGTQFDPEVVEAFVAREQDFARVSAANRADSSSSTGESQAESSSSSAAVAALQDA